MPCLHSVCYCPFSFQPADVKTGPVEPSPTKGSSRRRSVKGFLTRDWVSSRKRTAWTEDTEGNLNVPNITQVTVRISDHDNKDNIDSPDKLSHKGISIIINFFRTREVYCTWKSNQHHLILYCTPLLHYTFFSSCTALHFSTSPSKFHPSQNMNHLMMVVSQHFGKIK